MNDKHDKKTVEREIFVRSLLTGFIGGILLGFFNIAMDFFNFSEIALQDFFWSQGLFIGASGWVGNILSILLIGIFSIMIAVIYYVSLRKIQSFWAGFFYGAFLWVLLFIILNPIYPEMKNITEWHHHTIISTLCLFSLYGIFIGYSISYDYFDTNVLEDEGSQE